MRLPTVPAVLVVFTFTLGAPAAVAQEGRGEVLEAAAPSDSRAPATTDATGDATTDTTGDATREATTDAAGAATTDAPAGPETVEATSAADRAREALRAANLGELASRSRLALQRARPLARSSGAIFRVERDLPRAEDAIRRLSHPARLARIPQLTQRELADLRQEWRRWGHTLEAWQEAINARASQVEQARSEVVTIRRSWSELRDLSLAAGAPEARHERIVGAHEEARAAATALGDARDVLASLADRISDLQIVVEDVSERLRDAAAAFRERVWQRDAPPIYEGLASERTAGPGGTVAEQTRESLAARASVPAEMLLELWPRAAALGALFAALLTVLVALARARDPKAAEELAATQGRRAVEVVRRPVSGAALLTLLTASVVLEHAPVIVYDVLFFATLVPLFRAVPPLSASTVRPLITATVVMLAIDRVAAMLPEGSAVLRLALLAEGLVSISGLLGWLRSARRDPARMTRWAIVAVTLTVVALAIAVLANVLGWVFLASVLTWGTSFSVYNGLALAGAVIVLGAIVDLAATTPLLRRLRTVRDHTAVVHTRTLGALSLLAGLAWAAATLEGFGVWGPVSSWVEETLEARRAIGTLELSLGAVTGAIAILVATSFVVRFVRFVLELDVLPRLGLEPGVDGAISGLTRYVLVATGILLSLAVLGIDASQIALVAGALGVGIGFGLQGIVANFIAGIVLMLERPVRLGDFVEVGSLVGSVERIGLRSSTVRALDGAEVIVPNESLISREVINWTLSDRKRRVEVRVGVAYGTNPRRVLDILRGVLEAHDGVIQVDRARVQFEGFGESSLDFSVKFWAGSFEDSIRLRSEVGVAVHDALDAAGIQIPFPQRDVHVVSMPSMPRPSAS
jgi:small-conductance mechanosensitive channel